MTKKNVEEKSPAEPLAQKDLLALVRTELEKTGGERLSFKQFLAASGLGRYDVTRLFDSWNDVMREVGATFEVHGRRVPRERLLADWGSVAWKLKRLPTCGMYKLHGKYGFSTLSRCFGGWPRVNAAFREYAAGKDEWSDVLALVEGRKMTSCGGKLTGRKWTTARRRRQSAVSFGEPLPLPELRNAPTSENGVIYLFGVLAGRLGFSVETVRTAFPDCIAKRRVGLDDWQNVRIEFEYQSRSFPIHGHNPEGCDLIVCWTHNWPDCPKDMEVISLEQEIKRITQV